MPMTKNPHSMWEGKSGNIGDSEKSSCFPKEKRKCGEKQQQTDLADR